MVKSRHPFNSRTLLNLRFEVTPYEIQGQRNRTGIWLDNGLEHGTITFEDLRY